MSLNDIVHGVAVGVDAEGTVAVGGTGVIVAVGGTGVIVAVGGTGVIVAVGGTGVIVGGTGVGVACWTAFTAARASTRP